MSPAMEAYYAHRLANPWWKPGADEAAQWVADYVERNPVVHLDTAFDGAAVCGAEVGALTIDPAHVTCAACSPTVGRAS